MHLKITYCRCGNTILPMIPEIIFEHGLSPMLAGHKNKPRKGARGSQNRILLDLCVDCREKRDKKWMSDYWKKYNRKRPAREPLPIAATIA